MEEVVRVAGSFRDDSGYVLRAGGRIIRVVTESAREDYELARDSGLLSALERDGAIVVSNELTGRDRPTNLDDAAYVLEHSAIPFISYPYEWSFRALQTAALAHLDLQLRLLGQGFALSDASAYNVQFKGARPMFIDILSVRPYCEGEPWSGHRQFCEQFLNPLLLRALTGVAHNAWFRGNLEGIPTSDLARLIPLRRRFSWNVLTQVSLQARLEARAKRRQDSSISKARSVHLSKAAYNGFLSQLRNWIARLDPLDKEQTIWADYSQSHTYSRAEVENKTQFLKEFSAKLKPSFLLDIGCNTGDYSSAAIEGGAQYVVGFDYDQQAVDAAFLRAARESMPFLPLWLDAANPSPDQGWNQVERTGFSNRARADAMVALAFEHHLAIGRNIPLDQLIDWLTEIAPVGIIEFVPKTDPTVLKMLALRDDIFRDYTQANFESLLQARARLVQIRQGSSAGRNLYWFDKS